MNKAVSIDLNTNVEVGQEDIIVPGDKITFKRKNTEQYLGLLSNMTSTSGEGWMTTTNKKITLVSDVDGVATLDIDGKTYSIDSSTKLIGQYEISPNISGEIKSVAVDDTAVYYILEDKIGKWWFVKQTFDGVETERELTVDSTSEAFLLYNSNYYVISNETSGTVYDSEGQSIASLTFSSAAKAPNNGWWLDEDNWTIGRNDSDSYYAWANMKINGTVYDYKYMGCIDEEGTVTGEPVPVLGVTGMSVNYQTPTRLPNGVLKWTRLSVSDYTLLSHMTGRDFGKWDFSTVGDYKALMSVKGQINEQWTAAVTETGLNSWVSMIRRNGVSVISRTAPVNTSITNFVSWWITTDPSAVPGVFWTTSTTQYDNVFPMKYFFTNKQANRGKTFDYGKGWVRTYAINGGLANYSGNKLALFDVFSFSSYFYENIRGTEKYRSLDANNNQSAQLYDGGAIAAYGLPIQTPTMSDESYFMDSTVFQGNVRRHPLSSTQYNNRAWSQWYWQIGGENYGENGLVDTIPLTVTNGNISCLVYNGYTVGFSYNKVLINTPSKEIDVWTYRTVNGKTIITTSENVYVIGQGAFKLSKVADFIFRTNCLTEWNTFQESREGIIQLIRAFIPYNMSFEINSNWILCNFKAPADGSGANDIWMEGAAINANLDDKYLATSFLLPAVSIPLYVNGGDLTTFDKQIVRNNNPILVPVYQSTLFQDEELMVYYTHIQDSTDITYKMTVKGVDSYFDATHEDNSWWITSNTVFFPVGIASKFTGINYMSSTVKLEGDYTARLYVNNNQAYMVFNIAEQVYYGSTIFTIYTNNYYYDGEAIYSIVLGANEFVCYAIGLKFLGNSGTEAYFYSPYDKSIYLFSGSNTLSKARSLAAMGNIIDSMFSSVNQRMYLLDDNSRILWLSNESSGLYELKNIDHLESSEKGAIFCGTNEENGSSTYQIYSPRNDFDDIVTLELETNWIGDSTALNKFAYTDLQLFSQQPIKVEFNLQMLAKDGDDIKTTTKKILVKPSDWKGKYLKIRATPDETVGQAFKSIVKSDDLISIMNIQVAFEEVSSQPAPAAINI